MTNDFELVVFSPNAAQCEALHRLFTSGDVTVFEGNGLSATKDCGLDAIFITGMHLSYWGVDPFLKNHSEVMVSPKEKLALGLPKLFVAGWLGADADPASYGIRYAKLLLDAVDRYNEENPFNSIKRIGSLPDVLGLVGECAQEGAKALTGLLRNHAERWEQNTLSQFADLSNHSNVLR